MDYTPPDLCIRSLEEYKPGYYYLEMPSRYDPAGELGRWEVDQQTIDHIMNNSRNPVRMCPPGWPGPIPVEDCMEYHGARVGVVKAEEWCSD